MLYFSIPVSNVYSVHRSHILKCASVRSHVCIGILFVQCEKPCVSSFLHLVSMCIVYLVYSVHKTHYMSVLNVFNGV
jgi:hypothetical protein